MHFLHCLNDIAIIISKTLTTLTNFTLKTLKNTVKNKNKTTKHIKIPIQMNLEKALEKIHSCDLGFGFNETKINGLLKVSIVKEITSSL